jgi:putative DNA primase/helicase
MLYEPERDGNGNGHYPAGDGNDRKPPRGLPLTDMGNAERFKYWNGDDVVWCKPWTKFLIYDGMRYADDITEEADRRATHTIRRIVQEVALETSKNRQEAILSHAHRSEANGRVEALLKRARPKIAVRPDAFDADPFLFNVTNGTIDLTTGELRPHRKSDRITKLSPITYDPAAKCPLWLSTLERVFEGRKDLIRFYQRGVGYTMTGSTREQVFFFKYGSGANGKSLTLKTVKRVMGDYAKACRPETLMPKSPNAIPNDVAMLVGARMAVTTEVEEGARMAESLVKQLTGGDTMIARFLHGEFFEFDPTLKIWMAGNHRPVMIGTDDAIWRRVLTIPYTATIPEEEQDHELDEKLLRELPGILAWMVEGCLEWQRVGLAPPEAVRNATAQYREQMDTLGQFIEDCCEIGEQEMCTAGLLFNTYLTWAENQGERRPWNKQAFGRKLSERGFTQERSRDSRLWMKIGLRDDTNVASGDDM